MFGIQWDLVCKFLEVKSDLNVEDINKDSNKFGNYNNVKINDFMTGRYAIYKNDALGLWNNIINSYIKQDSGDDSKWLLSTGISEYTNRMNIYDFAGNVWEYTIERLSNIGYLQSYRGGDYFNTSLENPASFRTCSELIHNSSGIGFRSTLYKK